ncbi:MAG TPA: prenyltransferase/squalene oxidase repeat-containing protein, partial [Pirellulales bacterium]|nr:prenyltransferase/squalene oxidase repeat-containing protein [Pirellulales bacterium]
AAAAPAATDTIASTARQAAVESQLPATVAERPQAMAQSTAPAEVRHPALNDRLATSPSAPTPTRQDAASSSVALEAAALPAPAIAQRQTSAGRAGASAAVPSVDPLARSNSGEATGPTATVGEAIPQSQGNTPVGASSASPASSMPSAASSVGSQRRLEQASVGIAALGLGPGTGQAGPGASSTGSTGAAPALAGGVPRRADLAGSGGGPIASGTSNGSSGATTAVPRQRGSGATATIDVPRLAGVGPATGIPGSGAPGGGTAGPGTATGVPAPAALTPGSALMAPTRGGGVPVHIPAPAGLGGLDRQPSADLGLPNRLARAESNVVHTTTPRMILEKTGGEPMIDARVRDTAVEGLKQRDRENRGDVARSRGGTAETERAVELGLDFLARHQASDGSWSLHAWHVGRDYADPVPATMHSSTAGAGLALLAFLGAGYTHTDGKYRNTVAAGLDYITSHQKPDGDLFVPQDQQSNLNVWLYSHGIAAIALCEAYGMTRDVQLREPAQRALDFIVYAQHPQEGGWRYSPQQGSDTSVSGWQVMALKSGELSGLNAPAETYAKLVRWLDAAQGAGGNPSRYAYRPNSKFEHQREPSRVMTAEALLMRQYLGWRRDNVNMIAGAEWLRTQLPQYGEPTRENPSGVRDAYYWYYATQVMFQMQGSYWQDWNQNLRALLVDSQEQNGPLAGSWHPLRPVPDRWGNEGGRLYVTALNLLMLEVYYRHLPIYQTLD